MTDTAVANAATRDAVLTRVYNLAKAGLPDGDGKREEEFERDWRHLRELVREVVKPEVSQELLNEMPEWDRAYAARQWFEKTHDLDGLGTFSWRSLTSQFVVHRHLVMRKGSKHRSWARALESHLGNYGGEERFPEIFPAKRGLPRGRVGAVRPHPELVHESP